MFDFVTNFWKLETCYLLFYVNNKLEDSDCLKYLSILMASDVLL